MRTIYKLSFVVLLYVAAVSVAFAQYKPLFYLYNIDTAKYPRVSANVLVQNESGARYQNLKLSDFAVFDNGVNVAPSLRLNCDTSKVPLPISVCLVIDQSASMQNRSSNGETYWEWVKFGVKTFVDSMQWIPPSKVALVSFGGKAFLRSDFQSSAQPIKDALAMIPNDGATNYDEAFFGGAPSFSFGGIPVLKRSSPMTKRILIILSDGIPDKPPITEAVIDSCKANSIIVYAINLYAPPSIRINADLQTIAANTGGKAFLVYNKEELSNVYNQIAKDVQRDLDCKLLWDAPKICDNAQRQRKVDATFFRTTPLPTYWSGTYTASTKSIVNALPELSKVTFIDPGTSAKQTKVVRFFSPETENLNVLQVTSSSPQFVVKSITPSIPGIIAPKTPIDVTVEFTQTTIGTPHNALLTLTTPQCSSVVAMNVIIPNLKLETPVDGGKYNLCDSVINIRWSGVPADEGVVLSYTIDNGRNWLPIAANAKGLQYSWVPKQTGKEFKVRAARSACLNANSYGGVQIDSISTVASNASKNMFAAAGVFSVATKFGSTSLVGAGAFDAWIAGFQRNGNVVFAKAITGANNERITNIVEDESGGYYAIGETNSQSISTDALTLQTNNSQPSTFIIRYNSAGAPQWITGLGANSSLFGASYPVAAIRRSVDNSLAILAYARGSVQQLNNTDPNRPTFDAPFADTVWQPITIIVNASGAFESIQPSHKFATIPYPTLVSSLGTKDTIASGFSFSNSFQCNTSTITGSGSSATDVAVQTISTAGTLSSENKAPFSVGNSSFVVLQDSLICATTELTKSNITPSASIFKNAGIFPLTISKIYITGIDAADFSIDKSFEGTTIKADDFQDIVVRFTPRVIARKSRKAQLVFITSCGQAAFLPMRGDAKFPNLFATPLEFESQRLQTTSKGSVWIKNYDVADIEITNVSVTNPQASFSIDKTPAIKVLKSGDSVAVPVTFIPNKIQQDSIGIEVTGKGLLAPVFTYATGSGWLPEIKQAGYSFKPHIVGSTSAEIGSVVIVNTSATTPLTLYSINVASTGNTEAQAFTAITPVPTRNIIKPLDSIVVQYSFTPTKPVLHKAVIEIDHDAVEGPNTEPHRIARVELTGEGIQDQIVNATAINLPTIIACDTITSPSQVVLRNNSPTVSTTYTLEHTPAAPFSASGFVPTLAPNASMSIAVSFTPNSVSGNFQDSIVISSSTGLRVLIPIAASSSPASLTLFASPISSSVGAKSFIKVQATIESQKAINLNSLVVRMTNPRTHFMVDTSSALLGSAGWNWTYNKSTITNDFVDFIGTNNTPVNGSFELLHIPINVFLGVGRTSDVSISALTDLGCLNLTNTTSRLTLNDTCAYDFRAVNLSTPQVLLVRVPEQSRTIEATLGFYSSAQAMVQIVSSQGEIVTEIPVQVDEQLRTHTINTSHLASGAYFVRYIVGSTVKVQQILLHQ